MAHLKNLCRYFLFKMGVNEFKLRSREQIIGRQLTNFIPFFAHRSWYTSYC